MFFVYGLIISTVVAVVCTTTKDDDLHNRNRSLELIGHSNYTRLKAIDKRSSEFQKQRKPYLFDRIFGKPSPGDKKDEDDRITVGDDDDEPVYIRTKRPFDGFRAGELGPAGFPGLGGGFGAPGLGGSPVAGIGYSAPALGVLDPLFLMITLSFILFLVNSILGLVDRGRLAGGGGAAPVRGRAHEFPPTTEKVDDMERKLNDALQKYQI